MTIVDTIMSKPQIHVAAQNNFPSLYSDGGVYRELTLVYETSNWAIRRFRPIIWWRANSRTFALLKIVERNFDKDHPEDIDENI